MFVPDYEPDEDELLQTDSNPIRGRTNGHNKGRRCPSCPERFTNVRRHVLRNHLPRYISPATACWECRSQYSQTSLLDIHLNEFHNASAEGRKFYSRRHQLWVELVNGLLEALCTEHKCSSILGLCRFAEQQIKFENYDPVFQENDLLWVCVFNQLNHYTADSPSITVKTPFYVYTLLHWKILSQLISLSENKENLLSSEQPKYMKSYTFVPPHISLVDSHFHLDMLSKRSGDDALPPYKWRWGGIDYSIFHLIANYCYPRNWPSSKIRSRVREDPRIRFERWKEHQL